MARFGKWIIGAAVALILFTVIGFFVVPPVVKPYLLETVSKTISRPVSLADLSFNPYTLTATLRGLEIKEPRSDATFLSFDELVVNLDVRSLLKRAPVIEEFILRKPYVHLVRNRDKTYNFTDLLELKKEEPKDEKKEPFFFSVHNQSLIHISEPTRLLSISYAVLCLKKKKTKRISNNNQTRQQ